jgi:hypothetical protein
MKELILTNMTTECTIVAVFANYAATIFFLFLSI